MATRSQIAIQKEDGTIKSAYCHWDGYIENNGKMLSESYTDEEKINNLIDLGSLSSLDKEVAPKGGKHEWGNKQDGVTVAYHRDRGDELCVSEYSNLKEYENDSLDYVEYSYIWMKNEWYVKGHETKGFEKLSKFL